MISRIMRISVYLQVICWLLLATVDTFAQATAEPELGYPLLANFDKREYGAHPQNSTVIQDHRGVMYIGNSDGVLEYNGRNWRLIQTYNATAVRSLAIDEGNRIYVGAQSEFGYLATDSTGRLEFVSLSDELSAEEKRFSDVWSIYLTDQGVYFLTTNRIFLLNDGKLQSWEPNNVLVPMPGFYVNGRLYLNQRGKGLTQFENGAFKDMPNGDYLSNSRIYTMLPYGKNEVLIGTRSQGMFIYDGDSIRDFITQADEFFFGNLVSGGLRLQDGTYAISTNKGGIAIIDHGGKLIRMININVGIADNNVLGMYLDHEQGLWLATGNGLSRVELHSPLSYFDKKSGLEGDVLSVQKHDGMLFAATSQGLYYMRMQDSLSLDFSDPDNSYHAQFKAFKGFRTECRWLLSMPNALLVASASGVYSIENNQYNGIYTGGGANTLYRSQSNPNRIYVGLEYGLAALRKEPTGWRLEFTFDNINDNITSVVETKDAIWATTALRGILKLRKTSGMPGPQNVKRYTINNDLPFNKGNLIFLNGEELVFSTENGLYKFDDATESFKPNSTFNKSKEIHDEKVLCLNRDDEGLLWIITSSNIKVATPTENGEYEWNANTLNRIPNGAFVNMYLDKNNIRWFCGAEGIMRYDASKKDVHEYQFHTLTTKVTTGEDSVLFSGSYIGNNNTTSQVQNDFFKPTLPFTNNSLRFEFAAPTFDYQEATLFQFKLEGFNDNWSAWTDESRKEYTNISEGSYTFKVRAKNVYGVISEESSYAFVVLPPWYRTTYAYLGFGLAVLVFIYLIVVVRSKQLRKEKRKLEKIVSDRTQELEESVTKLKDTQAQLVENEKLASLGQLTAGIAHEIKNPLNFVTNFAELSVELLDELGEDINQHKDKLPVEDKENIDAVMDDLRMNVKKINEHGKRADNIVKGMLMHSRKESEEKEMVAVSQMLDENINFAYKGIRGKNKEINVEIVKEYDDSLGNVNIIRQDVSRVLLNLANNAFYAAYKKGLNAGNGFEPTVTIGGKKGKGYVEIFIQDNGVGISNENIEKIFNPFFTTKPTGEGTGLGLSISHDIIVKGHGGDLIVESEEGKFTKFIIKLPSNG